MSWTRRHLALAAVLAIVGCFTDPGVATSASGASAAASDPSGGAPTSSGDPSGGSTGSASAGTETSASTSTGTSTGASTSTSTTAPATTTTTDPGTSAASLDPTTSTSTTGDGPTEICWIFCGVEVDCNGGSFDACVADCVGNINQDVVGCEDRWASFALCVSDLTCTQYQSGTACVPELNELVIVCEECQSKVVDGDWCEVTYECWDLFQIACIGDSCECAYNGNFLAECLIGVPDLCALDDASILEIAAECCPWLAN